MRFDSELVVDRDLSAGVGSVHGRSNSDGGDVVVYRSKPDNDGE